MTMLSSLFTGVNTQEVPKISQNMQQNDADHGLTRQKTNESQEEHIDMFANVRDTPVAAWHIHGTNKYYNDEEYRRLVEEASAIMMSGIM